jgi:hypothetical protein
LNEELTTTVSHYSKIGTWNRRSNSNWKFDSIRDRHCQQLSTNEKYEWQIRPNSCRIKTFTRN